MTDLIVYISHAIAIVILGINIAICISKQHKLKKVVNELAKKKRIQLIKIDRLEREIILLHEALLRAKEQHQKQQQYGQR